MARPNANPSRKLADASPLGRADRIERKGAQLKDIQKQISDLEIQKKELSAQLLKLVKLEATADDEGKLRYETEGFNYVVVESKSSKLNTKKLMKLGVSARIIKRATVETPYEYVRVDLKKEE